MSEGVFYSAILAASIVIVGICGASIERSIMRGQAVAHNAAFYDPYTAEFTWREK